MRYTKLKKALLFCAAVICSFALFAAGCGGDKKEDVKNEASSTVAAVEVSSTVVADAASTTAATTSSEAKSESGLNILGEGKTTFALTVTDKEGNETQFEIHTDKETVGEALVELGLIEGEESEYGLYVKTVNKITADYDKDGAYWAFYINGEYASTGVDSTKIVETDSYALKIEK